MMKCYLQIMEQLYVMDVYSNNPDTKRNQPAEDETGIEQRDTSQINNAENHEVHQGIQLHNTLCLSVLEKLFEQEMGLVMFLKTLLKKNYVKFKEKVNLRSVVDEC